MSAGKAPDAFLDAYRDAVGRFAEPSMSFSDLMDAIYAAALNASGLDVSLADLQEERGKFLNANLELHQENSDKDARIAELEKALDVAADVLDFYGATVRCAHARAALKGKS